MDIILVVEQVLNGLQFGLMLFLLAAGLTLVFGVMDLINLARGSLYMVGAYLTATVAAASGSFVAALGAGVCGTVVFAVLLEEVFSHYTVHWQFFLGAMLLLIVLNAPNGILSLRARGSRH
jgi:branched-chain amino acid transport system permease protein